MGARSNVKRDRFIEAAVASAKALDREVLDPGVLFGRASNDDLEHYSPAMLAEVAAHAKAEIAATRRKRPEIMLITPCNPRSPSKPVLRRVARRRRGICCWRPFPIPA